MKLLILFAIRRLLGKQMIVSFSSLAKTFWLAKSIFARLNFTITNCTAK